MDIIDWRTLIDRNESQMTTLKATFHPFVGTLINELGFVRFSSMTSNFLDNTCTKIQNMAFKTSQMDQIALEY